MRCVLTTGLYPMLIIKMHHVQQPNSSIQLQQWEDARATLANAVNMYLHQCLSLDMAYSSNDTPPKNIASRIDFTLEPFHTTLNKQISQAKSALAHSRNKVLSPIYHCPEEVLFEIFSYVIYDPLDIDDSVPMVNGLLGMYRSVHSLLGVCTMWKSAVLARGSFWSTVPIMAPYPRTLRLGCPQAMHLSLERAGGADLHLAAIIPHCTDKLPSLDELSKYASQFRTINIMSGCEGVVRDLMEIFGRLGASRRLSDLSIQLEADEKTTNALPQWFNYVINPNSSTRSLFDQLLPSLSEFRLHGSPIFWDHVRFSNQLTKLELQEFTLGYDSEIAKVMVALSSASELRHLKFISVKTFPNPGLSGRTTAGPKITLPKLQTLPVQDLYANTLECSLPSIGSRSHQLTLHLTEKTFRILCPGESEAERGHINQVIRLFGHLSVNTLLLDGGDDKKWMCAHVFREILESMPELKALHMDYWDFDEDFCEALQRPSADDTSPFPQLKNLHISSAKIWEKEMFEEMIASHSGTLERLELGAAVCLNARPGESDWDWDSDSNSNSDSDLNSDAVSEEWASVNGDDELAVWLEENVPDFKMMSYGYNPREFRFIKWQL
ncbi:hypothetical protein B0J17DRAFT_401453 [Rhizoctonia solani]|nr:hypothetical protein B0J17DRAFT_401453 [Rhizoctonia solani]